MLKYLLLFRFIIIIILYWLIIYFGNGLEKIVFWIFLWFALLFWFVGEYFLFKVYFNPKFKDLAVKIMFLIGILNVIWRIFLWFAWVGWQIFIWQIGLYFGCIVTVFLPLIFFHILDFFWFPVDSGDRLRLLKIIMPYHPKFTDFYKNSSLEDKILLLSLENDFDDRFEK